jgi:hypothetical protein
MLRWGTTCANKGDTWTDLAKIIYLDENEASKWSPNYDPVPVEGKTYMVPNVVVAYTASRVWPEGFYSTVAWSQGQVSRLDEMAEKAGFHVIRRYNADNVSLFKNGFTEAGIGAYLFAMHGAPSTSGASMGAVMPASRGPDATTPVAPGDVSPPYHLARIYAFACGSANNSNHGLSSSPTRIDYWKNHVARNGLFVGWTIDFNFYQGSSGTGRVIVPGDPR